MVNDPIGQAEIGNDGLAFDVLQELEKQTTDWKRAKRSHERLTIKAKVTLRPGNSSELLKLKLMGVTGDISEGGCRAMFPIPIRVGDVYRLQFDHERVDLPLIFARCLRCQLIEEDAYEAGFKFFNMVNISEALRQQDPDLLI